MDQTTVLLVEDSDSVRLRLMEVLRGAGYRVLPAIGALSAIDHLTLHDGIDLMVTDHRIPSIDGSVWLRFLAKFFRPGMGIGVMSSYRIDPLGFPFLKKPFSDHEFLEFVASLRTGLPAPDGDKRLLKCRSENHSPTAD